MSIKVLPKILVDKIAAGEVIERPASVVKELLENSVDADASRIEIDLEKGGAKRIKVTDDGNGMPPEDLKLAFVSHATSKLESEQDLFDVKTMGFRGEALSSIASVSHASITSRTHDTDEAYSIRAEGGEIGELQVCGAPPGTQVEIRNLFYNVPVRRKFLKTQATEMGHVTEAVTRLALAHPSISFVLTHNGRQVFNLPEADDREERIGGLFGGEIANNIIPFHSRHPEIEIEGYLLPPSVDRSNTNMQYTFVNNRYIREKTLMHAIGEAYKGLMQKRRRPVCFLFLTLDPKDVDVNVHPTKTEVKFRNSGAIHSQVTNAMREKLRESDLTPELNISDEGEKESDDNIKGAIADFFGKKAGSSDSTRGEYRGQTVSPEGSKDHQNQNYSKFSEDGGTFFQLLDRYIIEECEQGIRIIDQHALHESILHERMQKEIKEGSLNSQQLLVPDLVELTKPEFFAIKDLKEELADFGMKIEDFGDQTIIVRSIPQLLDKFDGATFFRDLLDEFGGPSKIKHMDDRIDNLVKIMACKGAVKAGQHLDHQQMKKILKQRASAEDTNTCPHGRPTTMMLSQDELDKQFGRT